MKTKIYLLFLLIFITACKQTYRINPEDTYDDNTSIDLSNKGLVIFDTEFYYPKGWGEGVRLEELHTYFINVDQNNPNRITSDGTASYVYDFVNHPNERLLYGLPKAYGLRGYPLNPGIYVLAYCDTNLAIEGRPNQCPFNRWKLNSKTVGYLYFRVMSGDVINLGKIKLSHLRDSDNQRYSELEIINNSDEASKYINNNYPNYADKLKHKLFMLTEVDQNYSESKSNSLPMSFFMTLPQ